MRIATIATVLATWGLAVGVTAPARAQQSAAPNPIFEHYMHPQQQVALPDGRKINLYCTGTSTGAPTVILEGGWSASTLGWIRVQPRIAARTRVCSYDRAGYGFSDPGPLPRTAAAVAVDLQAALRTAGIDGPYIVVGHSLGGLFAREFAARAGKDVVGMVLVDPSAPYQMRRIGAASRSAAKDEARFQAALDACSAAVIAGKADAAGPCIDPPRPTLPESLNALRDRLQRTPAYQNALLSEMHEMEKATSDQVTASRNGYAALPLIVLTADKSALDPSLTPAQQEAATKLWWDMHAEIAGLSSRGKHVAVKESGHMVPLEHPEAVVAAVDELIETARAAH